MPLVAGENQGVGRAKVNGQVGGKIPTESSEHSKSSRARQALRPAIAGLWEVVSNMGLLRTLTRIQLRVLRQRRDNTASPVNNSYRNTRMQALHLVSDPFFPMALTPQDIVRIANLARLELSASESERMLAQLNGFFDIVEKMRAVDTQGIEPLAHPVATIQDVALRLREDMASEPNNREANQKSAPLSSAACSLCPK
jgi:aspartyl-tRNA(Asn)/glutamyl-tRNA(Gln) amidotransferase subunit C